MKFRAICENHLFSKAYSKGKRAVSSALAVYVLPDFAAKKLARTDTRKQMKNRYGLTVSTKIGGAVVRSRLRRIMRAALQALEKEDVLKVGFLIVIAARSEMTRCSSTEVKGQLYHAFDKLGLLK